MLTDIKTYLFFVLGCVCNVPNGGISNFGTLIVEGLGFSTLETALMQIPYGVIIIISILTCVFANDYMSRKGRQTRVWFVLLFLCPNIAGAFGLRFLAEDNQGGRLACYYLTGPYNAAFVLLLSITIANTAGHTKKACRISFTLSEALLTLLPGSYKCHPLPRLLYGKHHRSILLPVIPGTSVSARHLEHDRVASDRSLHSPPPALPAEPRE